MAKMTATNTRNKHESGMVCKPSISSAADPLVETWSVGETSKKRHQVSAPCAVACASIKADPALPRPPAPFSRRSKVRVQGSILGLRVTSQDTRKASQQLGLLLVNGVKRKPNANQPTALTTENGFKRRKNTRKPLPLTHAACEPLLLLGLWEARVLELGLRMVLVGILP